MWGISKLIQVNKNIYFNALFTFLLTTIIGLIDLYTGYELSFQFFYFVPLALIASNENQKKRFLVLWIILIAIVWFLADYFSGHIYSNFAISLWNALSRFIVFIFFSLFLNTIVRNRTRLNLINEDLARKNKLISDSVEYAKNIQNSVIPDYNKFTEFFPNSFIFSKPKDVLSGDFFWSHSEKDKIIFAMVDCTGHGIPGALLSVIGVILLNKIVVEKNIQSPSEILKILNNEVIELFSAGNELIDDGMEVCIVSFDKSISEINVAQTSNSIVIIDTEEMLTVINTDDFTIGGNVNKNDIPVFVNHNFKIKEGTLLYLFTDGYVDQFGSEKNKKFGMNKFLEKLKIIHKQPILFQFEELKSQHLSWKGNLRQTDDITVVGLKF